MQKRPALKKHSLPLPPYNKYYKYNRYYKSYQYSKYYKYQYNKYYKYGLREFLDVQNIAKKHVYFQSIFFACKNHGL